MIERPKLNLGEYGELFEHTEDEKDAVVRYAGIYYKLMNSLFVNNDGKYEKRNDFMREYGHDRGASKDYYIRDVKNTIADIPRIYAAMLKSEILNRRNVRMQVLHRGTSMDEVNSMSVGKTIDKLTSATEVYEGANWESYMFYENKDAPVHMQIRIDPNSRSTNNACFRNFGYLFWMGKRNYGFAFC